MNNWIFMSFFLLAQRLFWAGGHSFQLQVQLIPDCIRFKVVWKEMRLNTVFSLISAPGAFEIEKWHCHSTLQLAPLFDTNVHYYLTFLVACTRLYTPLCRSVCRSVGWSVGRSVGHILLFLSILFSNVIFSHSKSF